MKREQNNKGFSLVELIVVIAIMAVLMGVLAPTLIGNVEKSRESTDLQNLDTIRGAVVTAMSDEAVHREVMTAVGTTGTVINLGSGNNISLTGANANTAFANFTNLQSELQEILNTSITPKSAAASATGVNLLIVFDANGAVSVMYTTGNAVGAAPVTCRRTNDENGDDRELVAGNAAASGGGATQAPTT